MTKSKKSIAKVKTPPKRVTKTARKPAKGKAPRIATAKASSRWSTNQLKVLGAVAKGKSTAREIADSIGIATGPVTASLKRLHSQAPPVVTRKGERGSFTWGLTSAGKRVAATA